MKHKIADPNIPRKGKILVDHLREARSSGVAQRSVRRYDSNVPTRAFSLIEFNLSGLCNRTCVFCPRSNPKIYPQVNKHIPLELYTKIMQELGSVDYDGLFMYSAFSEPLLYKRIEVLIELSKRYCPKVRVESVTDGDFVTPKKLRSLFDAGLDTLLISLYDGPHQVETFSSMMAEVGLTEKQVVLRNRWLPPEENYGIILTNRAGMVEIPEAGVGKLAEPLKRPCFYPFYQILIDYDGSVLLCPHDWGKKLVVGNLHNDHLLDLWNSRTMRGVRTSLARADRSFAPCRDCDVDGTLMGQGHFEEWMSYYDGKK